MSASETSERSQYLSFSLAGGDYAIGILQVKEILQYETVTRVPSVPASIRGVINLRGAVVPVIDLAVKFGLPATPVTKRTCILVVEASLGDERTVLGIMADAVREVLELASGEIEPPPSFGTQVRVDFILGMGKAGKGFVLLLDLDRVVSAGERELAAQLGRGGEPDPVPAPAVGPIEISPSL
jgi:purine-binding chemotaxis protein CheW